MTLVSFDRSKLQETLDSYRAALTHHPLAGKVLAHIIDRIPADFSKLSNDPEERRQAEELVQFFGMKTIHMDPHDGLTYDGTLVACDIEPSVVIHEVGHYQCAAPYRRHMVDFGLGPGVVTGVGAPLAEAARQLEVVKADIEEALSSVLGILWEAELGHPSVLAFIDQEWMAGGPRGRDATYFIKVVEFLRELELIDDQGHPTRGLREMSDQAFFDRWYTHYSGPVPG
jgi:hypothetical protein